MKLIVPEGVSSLSHDGQDVPVIDGTIDVKGESFNFFHDVCGFITEVEQAAVDSEAGKAAAIAAAVVAANKKK